VAFGSLPFLVFGSCTVKVTTHLPAFRVLSLDLEIAQIFLEDFETDMVTVAFEETVLTPTRLAKVFATNDFLTLTVLVAISAAARAAELSTTGIRVQLAKAFEAGLIPVGE
jgi:hypothetical protein